MAQCPLCNTEVSEDFGLIECEGCSVQLIVHADGRVECRGAESKEILGEDSGYAPTLAPTPDVSDELFSFEEESKVESVPEQEPELEPEYLTDPEPEPIDPPAEYDFEESSGPAEPVAPVYNSANTPGSSDLSDVARFGNSDISGGRDGALRYTVFIGGIDTSDVRAAFREALTDLKFVWDIDAILRSVRNGDVTIQNVSPSKAYILISRLRGLPVRIRWEQYAIHQT